LYNRVRVQICKNFLSFVTEASIYENNKSTTCQLLYHTRPISPHQREDGFPMRHYFPASCVQIWLIFSHAPAQVQYSQVAGARCVCVCVYLSLFLGGCGPLSECGSALLVHFLFISPLPHFPSLSAALSKCRRSGGFFFNLVCCVLAITPRTHVSSTVLRVNKLFPLSAGPGNGMVLPSSSSRAFGADHFPNYSLFRKSDGACGAAAHDSRLGHSKSLSCVASC
jgi:hypothetical protein